MVRLSSKAVALMALAFAASHQNVLWGQYYGWREGVFLSLEPVDIIFICLKKGILILGGSVWGFFGGGSIIVFRELPNRVQLNGLSGEPRGGKMSWVSRSGSCCLTGEQLCKDLCQMPILTLGMRAIIQLVA